MNLSASIEVNVISQSRKLTQRNFRLGFDGQAQDRTYPVY